MSKGNPQMRIGHMAPGLRRGLVNSLYKTLTPKPENPKKAGPGKVRFNKNAELIAHVRFLSEVKRMPMKAISAAEGLSNMRVYRIVIGESSPHITAQERIDSRENT